MPELECCCLGVPPASLPWQRGEPPAALGAQNQEGGCDTHPATPHDLVTKGPPVAPATTTPPRCSQPGGIYPAASSPPAPGEGNWGLGKG